MPVTERCSKSHYDRGCRPTDSKDTRTPAIITLCGVEMVESSKTEYEPHEVGKEQVSTSPLLVRSSS